MNKLKVLAMSDLHGKLPAPEDLPKTDLVAIAGDISPIRIEKNMPSMLEWLAGDFAEWAKRIDAATVFLVAGNHDFVFADKEFSEGAKFTLLQMTRGKCKYLQDEFMEVEGKIIYGSPWVVGPKGFAFVDPKLDRIIGTMPERADWAILHQPLKSCENGMVHDSYSFEHADFGSSLLDEIVASKGPRHIVTGHTHTGNHNMGSIPTAKGTSVFWNVSILDEEYKMTYEPLLFEI